MICVRQTLHRLAVVPLAAAVALAALGSVDPADAKSKKKKSKRDPYALTRPVGPAVLAVVSLDSQRVTIYDGEGPILSAPVSSGQTGSETPPGIYSILQKNAEHYSNLYNNAAMPHMQRITWSGVALHGGPLPGYPASHGCVRLPFKFAKRLFDVTRLGTRVIVSNENVAPVAVSHPLLFKRTPYTQSTGIVTKAVALVGDAMALGAPPPASEPADVAERATDLTAIADAKTAEADAIEKQAEQPRALAKKLKPAMKRAKKALRSAQKARDRAAKSAAYADKKLSRAKSEKSIARAQKRKEKADAKLATTETKLETVTAEMQPKIDAYQEAADALKELEDARDALRAEADAAKRKLAPVKVFISRETGKLYVRQGFQPVFETDVIIRDPHSPIGTHTFTAVDYADGGREMHWNVVSISGRGHRAYYDDNYGYDDYGYYGYDDYYDRRRRRTRHKKKTKPKPTDLKAATAALDRITIPDEAMEHISQYVVPGSSLIVSDEAAHKETGKQTGFVVLISGEPQGAIKKKPRRRDYWYDDGYYSYDNRYNRRRQYRRLRRGRGPMGWW